VADGVLAGGAPANGFQPNSTLHRGPTHRPTHRGVVEPLGLPSLPRRTDGEVEAIRNRRLHKHGCFKSGPAGALGERAGRSHSHRPPARGTLAQRHASAVRPSGTCVTSPAERPLWLFRADRRGDDHGHVTDGMRRRRNISLWPAAALHRSRHVTSRRRGQSSYQGAASSSCATPTRRRRHRSCSCCTGGSPAPT
jgi:hypothetical protein